MKNKLDVFAPIGACFGLVANIPTDEITEIATAIATLICTAISCYNAIRKLINKHKNGKDNNENDIQ